MDGSVFAARTGPGFVLAGLPLEGRRGEQELNYRMRWFSRQLLPVGLMEGFQSDFAARERSWEACLLSFCIKTPGLIRCTRLDFLDLFSLKDHKSRSYINLSLRKT